MDQYARSRVPDRVQIVHDGDGARLAVLAAGDTDRANGAGVEQVLHFIGDGDRGYRVGQARLQGWDKTDCFFILWLRTSHWYWIKFGARLANVVADWGRLLHLAGVDQVVDVAMLWASGIGFAAKYFLEQLGLGFDPELGEGRISLAGHVVQKLLRAQLHQRICQALDLVFRQVACIDVGFDGGNCVQSAPNRNGMARWRMASASVLVGSCCIIVTRSRSET